MKLNNIIDHTLLRADATKEEIIRLCEEAKEHGFASVCTNSCYTSLVHEKLSGSNVLTCSVVGFPLGAMSTAAKAFETKQAIADGADEIDMVIQIGALKSGDYDYVLNDIKAVVDSANGKLVKVIIETCMLDDKEKIKACELAAQAKAGYVKTSTGFGSGGATAHDVALMRKTVGESIGVKASGGVRCKQDALDMHNAGASRIGTSGGIEICK